jgi:hypothetical protein
VLVSIGCHVSDAAKRVGCSYPTIRRESLRHPEFRRMLRQAMKMKAEINTLRSSNSQLNHTVTELQQKLCAPPSVSRDDEGPPSTKPP